MGSIFIFKSLKSLFSSTSFWQHWFPCIGINIGPQETDSWTSQILNLEQLSNSQLYIIWTWALLYCEVGWVSVLESLVSPDNVVSPGGLNALLNKMHLLFSLSRIFLSHSKPTVPFWNQERKQIIISIIHDPQFYWEHLLFG